ncbi:MAG: hypothetical protein K2I22_06125 [Lachnospiraceae bacterium]|nr:hypothetical protein [Lachnospiraceae bacterium]
MGRYIQDVVLYKPTDFVVFMMNDFLSKNSFHLSTWKKEPVYRAGDAVIEGYQYLKWYYDGCTLHVEAWISGGGIIGAARRSFEIETGLEYGARKEPFLLELEQLFDLMRQELAPPVGIAQPIPVLTVDNSQYAKSAFVMGLCSVIFGLPLPFFGVPLSFTGAGRARRAKNSNKAGMAAAGRVLCFIGMLLSVIGLMGYLVIASRYTRY